LPGWGGLDC